MGQGTMRKSVICLSFLLCLGSLVLTSEEEEQRQINLALGPGLFGLGAAALTGAGAASLAGLGGAGLASLLGGGKGGKEKGSSGLLSSLFGGKAGKHGKGKGGE